MPTDQTFWTYAVLILGVALSFAVLSLKLVYVKAVQRGKARVVFITLFLLATGCLIDAGTEWLARWYFLSDSQALARLVSSDMWPRRMWFYILAWYYVFCKLTAQWISELRG